MPIDRPTFSESWYRVADLTPSLRSVVQTYRQQFRGRTWHIVRDPSNNQFFRLDDAAYHFVALLDGRRTTRQVWEICNSELGDLAPTQGEVIQVLGQLYASNLLRGNLPPDTQGIFDRYKKRRFREVRGYLSNFLFVRIPLFDPDRVLNAFVGVFGWTFSKVGFILWLGVMAAGFYFLLGGWGELVSGAGSILDSGNLVPLYLSFAGIKAIHEFGHGFACKKFGQIRGGGEMHVMGIMLLVFMPVPYVDASSSWAFRSKWHRAIVGAAGMYVELAVAALAVVVWANTTPGTMVHAIAYNLIFIASISTLLFNGNPLLRFDGYYILSDVLEIPNLYQRSREQLYYVVKRYVYGVRKPRNPSHSTSEACWLFGYAVCATIYRVFICISIILFVASKLFVVGLTLAIAAIAVWVLTPLGKFLKYLASNPELTRTRPRALAATVATLVLIAVAIGAVPAPDRSRAEGVVEPRRLEMIHLRADGFIKKILPSGTRVDPAGPPIMVARNKDLEAELDERMADYALTAVQRRAAHERKEPARAKYLEEQLASLAEQIEFISDQLDSLTVQAPFAGVWVSPEAERLAGVFVRPGNPLGQVASAEDLILRVMTDQWAGPRIRKEIGTDKPVEVRVKGNPNIALGGIIRQCAVGGKTRLPSAALGYHVGGSVPVDLEDQQGVTAAEPFFEVLVDPDSREGAGWRLFAGQRVIVRFSFGARPLAVQWWRTIRQVVQERLGL